jgi:hypothetical protein
MLQSSSTIESSYLKMHLIERAHTEVQRTRLGIFRLIFLF